jgi:hypothetical protein
MEIRSARRETFAVDPEHLWQVLSRVDGYRSWWPWLRHLDARGLVVGDRWQAVVQPPLPYRLRFDLLLDRVVPCEHVSVRVEGDIIGAARLDIVATADGSQLDFESRLAPASATLRTVSRMAAPIADYGHDWVIGTGLRQFRDRALP